MEGEYSQPSTQVWRHWGAGQGLVLTYYLGLVQKMGFKEGAGTCQGTMLPPSFVGGGNKGLPENTVSTGIYNDIIERLAIFLADTRNSSKIDSNEDTSASFFSRCYFSCSALKEGQYMIFKYRVPDFEVIGGKEKEIISR